MDIEYSVYAWHYLTSNDERPVLVMLISFHVSRLMRGILVPYALTKVFTLT